MLAVSVGNPQASFETLCVLLGTAAAQDVLDREPGDIDLSSLPPITPDPAAGNWCRHAFARWYEQWTPLNVPRSQALFDVAVAASHLGRHDTAHAAISEALDELRTVVFNAADNVVSDVLRDGLLELLASTLTELDEDDPPFGEFEAAWSLLSGSQASVDWDEDFQQIVADATRDKEPLGAARGAARPLVAPVPSWRLRRTPQNWNTSVDWALVPPRVVSPDEDAVTVAIGGTTVYVEVKAHELLDPHSPDTHSLFVRLVDPQSRETRAVTPLSLVTTKRRFNAQLDVSSLGGDVKISTLVADVFASDSIGIPAVGREERAAARVFRHCKRSLVTARLAAATAALAGDNGREDGDPSQGILAAVTALVDAAVKEGDEAGRHMRDTRNVDAAVRDGVSEWTRSLKNLDLATRTVSGDLQLRYLSAVNACVTSPTYVGGESVVVDDPGHVARPLLGELLLAYRRFEPTGSNVTR